MLNRLGISPLKGYCLLFIAKGASGTNLQRALSLQRTVYGHLGEDQGVASMEFLRVQWFNFNLFVPPSTTEYQLATYNSEVNKLNNKKSNPICYTVNHYITSMG